MPQYNRIINHNKEFVMGRPIEATSPLDTDTVRLLLWVSEYGTGQPNISRLYEKEAADGLDLGRGTFFSAIKGRSVTKDTLSKIDELIALRGWRSRWVEHLQEEHKRRVIQAFQHYGTYCSVCGHKCPNCGNPGTEQRRQAVKSFLKTDPVDLGCKVRDTTETE
jgi:hypothetical protein